MDKSASNQFLLDLKLLLPNIKYQYLSVHSEYPHVCSNIVNLMYVSYPEVAPTVPFTKTQGGSW